MMCSRIVFKCFKTLERLGDRITGAAGPFFVAFAVILISLGTVCFCQCPSLSSKPIAKKLTVDVIMPSLMWPLISGPICVLIALNLWMHYFYVVTVPPGFVDDPPLDSAPNRMLWASKKAPRHGELTGVRWSNELVITRAAVTKCRKCGQQKPEVSNVVGFNTARTNSIDSEHIIVEYASAVYSNTTTIAQCVHSALII
jgi:palmitoyltransferase